MDVSKQVIQNLVNRYHIENDVQELLGVLKHVNVVQPLQAMVEIGVCFGGSLKIWERMMPPSSTIIGVECQPAILQRLTGEIVPSTTGRVMDWEIEWTEGNVSKLRSDRNIYVVIGNSADPNTADVVQHLLGDKKIDFWFHDGMHYGPTPVYDYHNFKHLIRPDGLVCVADVNNMTRNEWAENCGGQALARELPEPKVHPVDGHRYGMCVWRKQEWQEFDPAAIVEKHNLRVPGPNAGGIDPIIYDYPERSKK